MKILGINISHHGSSCLLDNGEIVYFLEEDRISRIKNYYCSAHVSNGRIKVNFLEKLKSITNRVDYIIFSSFGRKQNDIFTDFSDNQIIQMYLNEFDKCNIIYKKYFFDKNEHHLYHASNGFYASGFDDAICLVLDGGGSLRTYNEMDFRELESFYYFSYKNSPEKISQHWGYSGHNIDLIKSNFVYNKNNDIFSSTLSNGKLFANVGNVLGFNGSHDAGKVMGLSTYSKNFTEWYEKTDWFDKIDNEWITSKKIKEFLMGNEFSFDKKDFKNHTNFIKKANLAKKLQNETLNHTSRLIKKAIDTSLSKNIVISGGYALNCVNNYLYLDFLPEGFQLYIDPISNDAGTALGSAKYLWYTLTSSKEKKPMYSLYLG